MHDQEIKEVAAIAAKTLQVQGIAWALPICARADLKCQCRWQLPGLLVLNSLLAAAVTAMQGDGRSESHR